MQAQTEAGEVIDLTGYTMKTVGESPRPVNLPAVKARWRISLTYIWKMTEAL
jgi:hypothetical protein